MNNQYENDDVTEDDVTEDEIDQEDDVEEEEDSPLETIVKTIMEEHHDILNNYASDPRSPEDVSENDAIKKFIKLKVRAKVMESFKCRQQWEDDKKLKKLFYAAKHAMKNDPDLEALDAVKHVLRKGNDITDLIERIIEEELENDDEEEEAED